MIKTRTSCPFVLLHYYSENENWAAQELRLGRMRPAGWSWSKAGLFKLWVTTFWGLWTNWLDKSDI